MSSRTFNLAPLLAAAKPAVLPAPWQRFRCHPAFIQLPDEAATAQLVAALRGEAAGGACELPDWLEGDAQEAESPRLHPALRMADGLVMALETPAASPGARRIYSGAAWRGAPRQGLIAPLEDIRAPRPAPNEWQPKLAVACSLADLACLWSIGVPAILGTELVHADTDLVKRLAQVWQALQQLPAKPTGQQPQSLGASAPPPEVRRLELVLFNFDVAALEHTTRPLLGAVTSHLQQMLRCCDVPLELSIWRPSTEQLDDLRFSVRFASANDARWLVSESVADSAEEASEPPTARPPASAASPPPNYAACLAHWEASQRQQLDPAERERRWHTLREAWWREVVAPLLQQGASETDVLRAGLWALLADQFRELFWLRHPADPQEGPRGPQQVESAADRIKRAREVIHKIQELTKELQGWPAATSPRMLNDRLAKPVAAQSRAALRPAPAAPPVTSKPR